MRLPFRLELPCGGETILLEPADLMVSVKAEEGWAGMVARDTQIALDTRITEELSREGMARDVVRHVQEQRKEAGLEMEDRILCTGARSPRSCARPSSASRLHRRGNADGRVVVGAAHGGRASGHGQGRRAAVDN